ncbi:MAG TPA: hypothetical protein VK427_21990, partial [Kofleriaceae bacterium]|nr:hypothetical protein [Kofleriaceae bacterium]
PRPVMICEPDADAFQLPLRAMLQQRPLPRELIAIEQLGELVTAARQHRPCLVLLNTTSRTDEARAVAQALRTERALRDVAMVAVTEPRAGLAAPELLSAGFDAVFAKPVLIGELERFLTSSSPR